MKAHRCAKDNKAVWFSMFLLEAKHLSERKSWADISIQNKESLWTAGDNLISEVIDAPSGAQGCILLQIPVVKNQEEQHTCSHSAAVVHHSGKSTTTCTEKHWFKKKKGAIYYVYLSIPHSAEELFSNLISSLVQSIWDTTGVYSLVNNV